MDGTSSFGESLERILNNNNNNNNMKHAGNSDDDKRHSHSLSPRYATAAATATAGAASSRSRTRSSSYSPVRVRTRPRGFDEETAPAPVHTCISSGGIGIGIVRSEIQMEAKVWQRLPDDLLSLVLARVWPLQLVRLRCVSKAWKFLVEDRAFLYHHSQARSHGPCLVTLSLGGNGALCCSMLLLLLPGRSWHRVPLGFLPDWAVIGGTLSLVGSSGGLLCLAGSDPGGVFRIVVCNPLTQQWRMLPCMHHNRQRHLIVVADRKRRFFNIVAVAAMDASSSSSSSFSSSSSSNAQSLLPTELYDSRHNRWTVHAPPPAINLGSSKMVFCDSKVYMETLSPLGLIVFRMEQREWEQIQFKFPRSLLEGHLVSGGNSRLFLVGRVRLYNTSQTVRIWELDHAKTLWVEIEKMPRRIFNSLRLFAERFECTAHDNLICFTSANQGKGLIYDTQKKTWSLINACARHTWKSHFTFYEPRFDLSVN